MAGIYKFYLLLILISVSVFACSNNANTLDNQTINLDGQKRDSIIMDSIGLDLSDVFSIAERTELSNRLKLIMGLDNYDLATSNHNWISIRKVEEDCLRAIYYDKKSVVHGAFCIICYDTFDDKLSVALSTENKSVLYFSEDTAIPENLIKEVKELRSNI
jgi:hypothetical protein